MKKLVWALLLGPMALFAQDKGIVFSQGLNWEQILKMAATEHKYIFVDCYATWCGPCKAMDSKVYPLDSVGQYVNANFISVKLQMDSTSKDSKDVRAWYATAHEFHSQYSVHAFPSFLFFSPDGRIVHKEIGARDAGAFLATMRMAMDSHQQYFALLQQYRRGALPFSEMPNLAKAAKKLGEDSVNRLVAADYIRHYLTPLTPVQLLVKEHIGFIRSNVKVVHYGDKIFDVWMQNRAKIDTVMGFPGYADGLVNTIVYSDEVTPKVNGALKEHGEPDWKTMEATIQKNYGEQYVKDNILKGRVQFYKDAQRWHEYAKYLVIRLENWDVRNAKPGLGSYLLLNNNAYEVFKYSDEKNELETALAWVDRAIAIDSSRHAEALDTKANLLYKLGQKSEGLALEGRSAAMAPANKEIQENFTKMKKEQPTWPVN